MTESLAGTPRCQTSCSAKLRRRRRVSFLRRTPVIIKTSINQTSIFGESEVKKKIGRQYRNVALFDSAVKFSKGGPQSVSHQALWNEMPFALLSGDWFLKFKLNFIPSSPTDSDCWLGERARVWCKKLMCTEWETDKKGPCLPRKAEMPLKVHVNQKFNFSNIAFGVIRRRLDDDLL